jgi:hypothetical protein
MRYVSAAACAFLIAAAIPSKSLAAYAGNVTVNGSGTCSEVSGTFPARVSFVTSSTETVYYITFIVPLPSPAPPQYLTQTLVFLNGTNSTAYAADPQLFGTLGEPTGSWSGPISSNANILSLGSNLVLQSNGSTTGTPLVVSVAFNGGTCTLDDVGLLFNQN